MGPLTSIRLYEMRESGFLRSDKDNQLYYRIDLSQFTPTKIITENVVNINLYVIRSHRQINIQIYRRSVSTQDTPVLEQIRLFFYVNFVYFYLMIRKCFVIVFTKRSRFYVRNSLLVTHSIPMC